MKHTNPAGAGKPLAPASHPHRLGLFSATLLVVANMVSAGVILINFSGLNMLK